MDNGSKNHKITLFFPLAAIALLFSPVFHAPPAAAQTSQTLYFMERIPQSGLLNPAYQHDHDFYIGIPMFSSINLNAKSNFASFNDFIFKHPQYDSLISFIHPDADTGNFTEKLKSLNTIAPELYYGILSAGYRRNNSYFRLDVSDRARARIDIPRDLAILALEGNEQYAGRIADISGFAGEMNYFREYALGYSYDINKWFNAGVRAKLLFGKADLSFSAGQMTLYTDPESYNLRLLSEFTMDMSMPLTLVTNEKGSIDQVDSHFRSRDYGRGKFLFSGRNPGIAFDAGAWFRISERSTLFSSITDLGYISWKRDAYNLSANSDFTYEGIDLSPIFDSGDGSDPVGNMIDTLKGLLTTSAQAYRKALPSRLYIGGTYVHRNGINIGLLSRFDLAGNNPEKVVTASLMKDINPHLTASLTWSFMYRHYNNPGIGLTYRTGRLNIYFLTDNLSSAIVPRRNRSMNMWFGCNLAFGHRTIRAEGR